jgi:hypothetical protein
MIAFFHVYRTARGKKHGSGKAYIRQAIMLGIQAQWIAWGHPRWLMPVIQVLLPIMYTKLRKQIETKGAL